MGMRVLPHEALINKCTMKHRSVGMQNVFKSYKGDDEVEACQGFSNEFTDPCVSFSVWLSICLFVCPPNWLSSTWDVPDIKITTPTVLPLHNWAVRNGLLISVQQRETPGEGNTVTERIDEVRHCWRRRLAEERKIHKERGGEMFLCRIFKDFNMHLNL